MFFKFLWCRIGWHGDPQLMISDTNFRWSCPRCHKTVSPPADILKIELEIQIEECRKEIEQLIPIVARNSSADTEEIKESLHRIYTLYTQKIISKRYGPLPKLNNVELLKVAVDGANCIIELLKSIVELKNRPETA